MDQGHNPPGQTWQSAAPQSERRTGSWNRNGGGSEDYTEVSAVSDALGIDMHPSWSHVSLDRTTMSPYVPQAETPRPDRPLLSSPRSVTSPRFHGNTSSNPYAAVPRGDVGVIGEQPQSPPAAQVRFVPEKTEGQQQQQQYVPENKGNPFAFQQVDLGTGQYPGAQGQQGGGPAEGLYAAAPGPYYPDSEFARSQDFADVQYMDMYRE